jgi:hypothetical protein
MLAQAPRHLPVGHNSIGGSFGGTLRPATDQLPFADQTVNRTLLVARGEM